MSTAPGPNDTETQIRLAVQTERLATLMERITQAELRNEAWRRETTASIEAVRADVAELKAANREMSERLKEVEKELLLLKAEVQAKVGVIWFRSTWSVILGIGILITSLGGIVTILRAFGVIH